MRICPACGHTNLPSFPTCSKCGAAFTPGAGNLPPHLRGAPGIELGQPTASRAVGLANGRNPLAVIVPCHRVIGANGTLTGFGGGLERKRWLLEHERAVLARHTGTPVAAGLW